mmetsp:Transcript_6973/g.29529  ORF Transcript_6973/g.29529 Transcript_6973/m.29529 type:complete len:323 (+) Transcript_6973:3735-4703(+)
MSCRCSPGCGGSEGQLGRHIAAGLLAGDDAGDDLAEVDIGQRQRGMLVGRPGQEDVHPAVFLQRAGAERGVVAEVVRLGAVFGADRHRAAQQIGHRDLGLDLVAVMAGGAEAEQAGLVGLGRAQRAVDQDALGQEELGRAEIDVGAAVLGAKGLQRGSEMAGLGLFVLEAHGDLRHPVVAVEDGVAGDAGLQADDVLLQAQAVEARVHQRTGQGAGHRAGVEILVGERHLEALAIAGGHGHRGQRIVIGAHARQRAGAADLAAGRIAAGHGPGRQATAGRALDGRDAAGQQQLALAAGHAGHAGLSAGQAGGQAKGQEAESA